jgi:uncharacterized protein (DUF4415 family)
MKNGFFSRFARPGQVENLAPGVLPRAEAAAAAAAEVAQAVRGMARQALPKVHRKSAISLRVDPEVLDWFKSQGPGYQTRMNAVLRAYKDASS